MKSLDEQVAKKMEWTTCEVEDPYLDRSWVKGLRSPDGKEFALGHLPPFSSDWNVVREYLIPFMRDQKSFIYLIGYRKKDYWHRLDRNQFFKWYCMNGHCSKGSAEIIDDDLAPAACKAFLQIDLEGE